MKNLLRHIRKMALVIGCLFLLPDAKAQIWSDVAGGMGDWVNAMTVYNGELIVGGRFTNAGGVPANHIAKFNGTSWSALGAGVDGWVNSLCVYNGELFAGGNFINADGQPVNFIARWNGTAWSDVSGGTNSIVAALTVYNNKLIVGGYFTDAEGVPVNYIGAWDENGWTTLGTGMGGSQGQVMALTTWGTDLIAAGFFTSAGGSPAAHIAKWNGSSWSTLGSGISSIVYSLTTYGTDLIAGGYYNGAGGSPAASIAKWNGSSWSPLGSGMGALPAGYNYVFALEVMNNHLYAGGMFLTAGGVTANGIAMWNGTSWSDLNGGVYYGGSNAYGVNALKVYDGGIFAGGLFTTAGTVGVAHIAKWMEAPLPVSLISFSAVRKTVFNEISWSTSLEEKIHHFVLEKSSDGQTFDVLANVPSKWNGLGPVNYLYNDPNPFNATYYRLVSVDIDGSKTYHKTVIVKRSGQTLQVIPTVCNDQTWVYSTLNNFPCNMNVFDASGRLVMRQEIVLNSKTPLQLGTLSPGIYILRFRGNDLDQSIRILKQ